MSDFKWLQYFADGASGGDGGDGGAASTGAETGAAGRSLEDLGVPRDKAERFRQRKSARPAPVEQPAQPESEQKPAMDWDTFFATPENKDRLQAMMAERGKKATEAKQQAEAQLAKMGPMLDLIAARYEIEPKDGVYDLDAITKAVTDDDSYYEQRAEDLGVDVSVAKEIEQSRMEKRRAEAQAEQLRQQQAKQEREFQLQQHFHKMQQQANDLRRIFPDFDLNRELQNPVFFQRTSPEGGMSVEDAFYSIHHNEIMERQATGIAKRAKADAAAAIRSGSRPRENGGSSMAAVSSTPDLKSMTREQRRAYIKAKYAPP